MVEIRKYCMPSGKVPFDRWLADVKDERARARVLVQIDRLALGLPGDRKSVGGGVFELRVFEGKGYRAYFAKEGTAVVLLLCGGNKSTQRQDIERAKEYWREYRRRT